MKKLFFLFSAILPILASAEDIELYLGSDASRVSTKPKVLIIFDNSGSMSNSESIKEVYSSSTNYDAVEPHPTKLTDEYVYYIKGIGDGNKPIVDSPTEHRRFLANHNNCESARDRLASVGYFTGYVREYTFSGSSGSWQEIPDEDGRSITIIDCLEDIQLADPTNSGLNAMSESWSDGYPTDGLGSSSDVTPFTTNIHASDTSMGIGQIVTLYSANYLRWSANDSLPNENQSRMEIAQRAMTTIIQSTPGIDFGLQIFNHNHRGENRRDGGRITFGIKDHMTLVQRNELIDLINDDLDPETNTPLCESLYEAMLYFGGKAIRYGDDDSDRDGYVANTPPRDTTIESSSNYISPFSTGCSNEIYVIMMTDGAPTRDLNADTLITALPIDDGEDPIAAPIAVRDADGNSTNNYLASLAGWMRNNDINLNRDGKQTSTLYTVGFGLVTDEVIPDPTDAQQAKLDAVALLKAAATAGGGKYFNAGEPDSLLSNLQSAILEILTVDSTFTAPSVASNNFDRTETLESVYYAMFTPDKGPRWQGNLKKLKLSGSRIVDADNIPAINDSGNIEDTARTIWSSEDDGGAVAKGGVVEMFSSKSPSSRVVYTDTKDGDGAINGLTVLPTPFNLASSPITLDNLASLLAVPEEQVAGVMQWALGLDIEDTDKDSSTVDMRKDVFGDPLHSKPLVLNYGGEGEGTQDVRIFVGTNAGALHMFNDQGETITENWAFMPTEFFKNYNVLKNNSPSIDKVYGIDGTVVSYIDDKNGDGKIDGDAGDIAYIFFGLRRGGSSYYAFDVSKPDAAPVFLWHIDEGTLNFEELGQTWSTPKVAFSKVNTDGDGKAKPVLIFGGGYSPSKDTSGVGGNDDTGVGIYMVDAATGTHIWSSTSETSTSHPGTDSVPSSITTLDSDSDGFIDRMYFGDTGGMVWRIDMPGTAFTNWSTTRLASLGSDTEDINDRRFFAEPTIARALITETFRHEEFDEEGVSTGTTEYQVQVPYDAILIGSGDRTSPLDNSTNDKLYMLKDKNIFTQTFGTEANPFPDVILDSDDDLEDYTDNPFQDLDPTSEAYEVVALRTSSKNGWFVELSTSLGEKSVAKARVFAGVAYFNAFSPTSDDDICTVEGGSSNLYAMDLALGINIYSNNRKIPLPGVISDGITFMTLPGSGDESDEHSESTDSVSDELVLIAGDAMPLCDADGNCNGLKLKTTRSYLVIEEE